MFYETLLDIARANPIETMILMGALFATLTYKAI